MICNSPSPALLFALGQARIVMRSLVMEFIGTIWQSAPQQRWDRIDHHSEFVFGVLHLSTGISRIPEKSNLFNIGGRCEKRRAAKVHWRANRALGDVAGG